MTTDLPAWKRRAQGNPYGVLPILYYPKGVSQSVDYPDGINLAMEVSQKWFQKQVGKTWRRLPTVVIDGEMTPAQMAPNLMGMYELSRAVLGELERRKATDTTWKRITQCGGDGRRAYVICVPGNHHAGNMIGFDATCDDKDPAHHKDNPLWPRPGVTGLAGKGLELISFRLPNYGADEWTKHESHADTPNEWIGALSHELGHIFGLPHPTTWDEGHSIMLSWWSFLSWPACVFLPREIETLRGHPFFR